MARADHNSTDFNRYLAALRASADSTGEGVVAYFDLDRTLIAGYSITALALTKMWSGSLSPKKIILHAGIFLHWGLGRSDYHELLEATVKSLVGSSEQEMIELGEAAFEKRIRPIIYEEGRQLIDAHKSLGHQVVMITSASRYQAAPVARELGVDHYYCTELEIADGLITGRVTACYGVGKKQAAVLHAEKFAAPLDEAYFYSDSAEDLSLLEAVGHPVTVNAKTSLARHAQARGWPALGFQTLRRGLAASRAA